MKKVFLFLLISFLVALFVGGCKKTEPNKALNFSCSNKDCIKDSDCECYGVDAVCGIDSKCVITNCNPNNEATFECPSGMTCQLNNIYKKYVCQAPKLDFSCSEKPCATDSDCACGEGVEAKCATDQTCKIINCKVADKFGTCPDGLECRMQNAVPVCLKPVEQPAKDDDVVQKDDNTPQTDDNTPQTDENTPKPDEDAEIFTDNDLLPATDIDEVKPDEDTAPTYGKFDCIGDPTLKTTDECRAKCVGVESKYAPFFKGCIVINCDLNDPSTCPENFTCTDVSSSGYGYNTFCLDNNFEGGKKLF